MPRYRLSQTPLPSGDSDVWLRYKATAAVYPLFEKATEQALTAAAMYLGTTYQGMVPSRRVAASVGFKVRPPRAYVGTGNYRANFLEVGARPHAFAARGTRLKTRSSRKKGTSTLVGAGQLQYRAGRRYMAIPIGNNVIFRTKVHHPGMRGGEYMRRTGQQGAQVIEQIMAASFRGVFQ